MVVATTETFVPLPDDAKNEPFVAYADLSALLIPAELYLLSVVKERIASLINLKKSHETKERPKDILLRKASSDNLSNCFAHSLTDHVLKKKSPRTINAPT